MNFYDLVLTILTAGGGGAAVAFLIFRSLGTSWMESLFAQRLEAFRHENAVELQALKANIDGTLNVRYRVQEREFECLTEVWDLMNVSFGTAQSYVSPLQSYPDIQRMSEGDRVEYLKGMDFYDFQKREIIESSKPNNKLHEMLDLKKYNAAVQAHAEFQNSAFKYEIIMSERISADFKSVAQTIKSALITKKVSKEDRETKMSREAWQELEQKCMPEVTRISNELRAYLRSSLANGGEP